MNYTAQHNYMSRMLDEAMVQASNLSLLRKMAQDQSDVALYLSLKGGVLVPVESYDLTAAAIVVASVQARRRYAEADKAIADCVSAVRRDVDA